MTDKYGFRRVIKFEKFDELQFLVGKIYKNPYDLEAFNSNYRIVHDRDDLAELQKLYNNLHAQLEQDAIWMAKRYNINQNVTER